ncbi:MAG: RDD family protein [Candidatus Heimdallarchaeota archaeon]|nr:MAG: RDD family protein [Candidatus Heimdallarchaeota archaeon]
MEADIAVLGHRIVAYFVDYCVIFLITVILLLFLPYTPESDHLIFTVINHLVFMMTTIIYFILLESVISSTAGKKLTQLGTIIDLRGKENAQIRIRPKQALLRNLVKIRPESLLVDFIIGLIMNRKIGQRSSELYSKTIVVRTSQHYTSREQSTNRTFSVIFSVFGIIVFIVYTVGGWLILFM